MSLAILTEMVMNLTESHNSLAMTVAENHEVTSSSLQQIAEDKLETERKEARGYVIHFLRILNNFKLFIFSRVIVSGQGVKKWHPAEDLMSELTRIFSHLFRFPLPIADIRSVERLKEKGNSPIIIT